MHIKATVYAKVEDRWIMMWLHQAACIKHLEKAISAVLKNELLRVEIEKVLVEEDLTGGYSDL